MRETGRLIDAAMIFEHSVDGYKDTLLKLDRMAKQAYDMDMLDAVDEEMGRLIDQEQEIETYCGICKHNRNNRCRLWEVKIEDPDDSHCESFQVKA